MPTAVVLVKGQNAPLTATPIVVTVEMAAPADLSALLVTANGKVRSDADFLFFNQPDGPGVSCRQTFEQVDNAFCRLVDQGSNAELARYTLTGGGAHTGMVMAKVFRDSGSWKLQAIGEGISARTPKDAVPQLDRFR